MAADALAIADDSGLRLGRQVADEVDALIDRAQLLEHTIDLEDEALTGGTLRDDRMNHRMMALGHLGILGQIGDVASYGQLRGADEFVGDAAKSGYYHDNGFVLRLNDFLDVEDAFC